MPYANLTPEALLGRSDSKNPATTCRGLTTAGKPCRRSIAASTVSGSRSAQLHPGLLTIPENERGYGANAAYYCWQHKTQAAVASDQDIASHSRTKVVPITRKTSLESLVARLGVVQIEDDQARPARTRNTESDKIGTMRDHPEAEHQAGARSSAQTATSHGNQPRTERKRKRSRPLRNGWLSQLCCFSSSNSRDQEPYYEIVRHRSKPPPPMRTVSVNMATKYDSPSRMNQNGDASTLQLPRDQSSHLKTSPPTRKVLAEISSQQRNEQRPSQTVKAAFSLIPNTVSPTTAALLATELSKPISIHDEAGYIYIFWLTDSDNAPDLETASSLLSTAQEPTRHIDSLARTYSKRSCPSRQRTVMLKIGRASNVHRRMTEWNRQCGYALSLVRWYPYVSRSPASTPTREQPHKSAGPGSSRPPLSHGPTSSEVRKLPHVHRVERLIHLELADKQVKRRCEACGKEHREWFEIEATAKGVKHVDEVVRRWATWAERRQSQGG